MSKRSKAPPPQDSIDRFLADVLPRYPSLDPQTEAAVDRMTKIVKHLDKVQGATVAKFGLNIGEFKVLIKLDTHGGGTMSAGELAERLNLSTGAMTNRLDGLEEAGHIERTRDPSDRRSVLVSITPDGRAILEKSVAAQATLERDLVATLGAAEKDQLNDLLRRLVLAIETPAGD